MCMPTNSLLKNKKKQIIKKQSTVTIITTTISIIVTTINAYEYTIKITITNLWKKK